VICTGMVVLAALVLRWVIEKPFLRLRDRVLERRDGAALKPIKEERQPAVY